VPAVLSPAAHVAACGRYFEARTEARLLHDDEQMNPWRLFAAHDIFKILARNVRKSNGVSGHA